MRAGAAESILVIDARNELRLESLPAPHPLSMVKKSPLPPLLGVVGVFGGLKVFGLLLVSTSASSAMLGVILCPNYVLALYQLLKLRLLVCLDVLSLFASSVEMTQRWRHWVESKQSNAFSVMSVKFTKANSLVDIVL